jgi:hypothetical protein
MPTTRSVTLFDRLGNRLRARMLANGHIALSEHAHRYTYARVSRQGNVELYDDNGNFSAASLGTGEDEDDEDTGRRVLLAA